MIQNMKIYQSLCQFVNSTSTFVSDNLLHFACCADFYTVVLGLLHCLLI